MLKDQVGCKGKGGGVIAPFSLFSSQSMGHLRNGALLVSLNKRKQLRHFAGSPDATNKAVNKIHVQRFIVEL